MNKAVKNRSYPAKWPMIFFSVLLIAGFFIPWVSWDDVRITGADMPAGRFFGTSEKSFKLTNPFPQFNFAITGLWLVPVLAIATLVLAFLNKPRPIIPAVAGILALSAATIYVLFSNLLIDLGVNARLLIGFYITILAAGGIILAGSQRLGVKIVLLLVGPLVTGGGFYLLKSYKENEKFEDTANTSSAYTVNALELIREFHTNDSLANAKYREQIITVNGRISTIDNPNDSTVNVKFTDETTGSYAIFPFVGDELPAVKNLKQGDSVSVKGSCSGGVLSEILGIESITFKRATLNK